MKDSNKPLFVKVVATEWKSATHDKRELKVAKDLGYETLVIANTKSKNSVFEEYVDEFRVIRVPTRRFGEGRIRKFMGRIWAVARMVKELRKRNISVISGHNYSGWIIGYLAKGKHKGVKYIYDSHEFELYQDGSNKFRYHIIYMLESFIFRKTTMTYTVSESIANDLKNIYSLDERPVVVRNIPERIEYNSKKVKNNREEFYANLNIDRDGTIIMYHGGITTGRGIEQAIEVLAKTENIGLVIMGFALSKDYLSSIKHRIKEINCEDRVYFKEAVNIPELYEYIAASDVGIVLSKNTCINHYYSLPNKLFENIQALTPVIASDFPEISKIVNGYKIGKTIDPDEIELLVEGIFQIKKTSHDIRENLIIARNELCWQNEKKILEDAIKQKCLGLKSWD